MQLGLSFKKQIPNIYQSPVISGDDYLQKGIWKNVRRDVLEDRVKDATLFHYLGEERLSSGSVDTHGQLRISCKAMVTQIQVWVADEAKQCGTDKHVPNTAAFACDQ